jgi:NarL family two-component system response regulator LiaR
MDIAISVVEDNTAFRSSLVQLIRSTEGLLFLSEYANAEKALCITKDNPDIAIIDIELPGMSGIDLIKKIKPLNNAIQYLVCSNYDDDDKIFSALESGASGYILKDCTSSQIIYAIKELYNGGSPMSPYIARRVIASFQKKKSEEAFLLSEREKEVLQLLSKGLLYKEIAEQLFISYETVKKHLKNIYQKLHVQNKVEAINKFRLF